MIYFAAVKFEPFTTPPSTIASSRCRRRCCVSMPSKYVEVVVDVECSIGGVGGKRRTIRTSCA